MCHPPILPDDTMAPHHHGAGLQLRLAGQRDEDALALRHQRARDHRDDQRQRAHENQSRNNRHDHLLISGGTRLPKPASAADGSLFVPRW